MSERHTLRLERLLRHPVERVWRALTEPGELSAWWPMRTSEVPAEIGAPMEFFDEEGTVSRGQLTHYEAGRVLGFTDSDGEHEVVFRLHPAAGGEHCRLEFEHTFPVDQYADQHAKGWNYCFAALEAAL